MIEVSDALLGFENGARTERLEFGVRYLRDHRERRRGDVEKCTEHKARWLTSRAARDELPSHGYPRDGLELVTRTVVTYTGTWVGRS